MAKPLVGVLSLGVPEVTFPDTSEGVKFDTKGKRYAFRVSVRGKVFKSRYVYAKELGEQKGYFSGSNPDDAIAFSLRFKNALGSHSIGEATLHVPPAEKGMFRMSFDLKKKEKTTATITVEIGYFPGGLADKISTKDIVVVDKHRDKEAGDGDGEGEGNEDLSDQGSEGDPSQPSDVAGGHSDSLPPFSTRSAADMSDGGEAKRRIIQKILTAPSKGLSEKYATFLKRFGYTTEEALYTEYPVAFLLKQKQSVVSLQGMLYRSSNFLSFYSNNFNQETIEKIKIDSLVGLSLLENNLDEQILQLNLDSGKEFQFAAPKQDDLFVGLLEEWEKNKLLPGNRLLLDIVTLDNSQIEFFKRPVLENPSEDDFSSTSRAWQLVDAPLSGFSVDQFLSSIVLSPFEMAYHAKRGDGDISVTAWAQEKPSTEDYPVFSRELNYQSQVKLKLQGVPARCTIHENQYYYFKGGSLYYEVVSSASGVPASDSFRTETVWIAIPEDGGIRLKGRMTCRFLKRTHLMGQIASAYYQIGKYTYKIWCETAMEFLQEVSFSLSEEEEPKSEREERAVEDKGKEKEVLKPGDTLDSSPLGSVEPPPGKRGSGDSGGDGGGSEAGRGVDPLPVVDNNEPVEPYLQANFTDLGSCKFPDTTVQVVFEKLFSDQSDVAENLHKKRKDWDTVITDWGTPPEGKGRVKTRTTDFKFHLVTKLPGMPSEASAQEKQRYYFMGDQLFVEAKALTFGVPYADYFETETKYVATQEGTGVSLQVSSGLHWLKKTWLSGKIETDTLAVQKENTAIFIDLSTAAFVPASKEAPASLSQDYGPVIPLESSGFLEQKLKEVGSVSFPGVTVEEMFNKFWSDSPGSVGLQEEYHRRKQETDFKMGKWERDEKYGNVKEMTYKTPSKVRVPGVPAYAPVVEKVRFSLASDWLEMENLIQTAGIPYSDYFLVEQRWKIVAENGAVVVTVFGGVRFLKKSWLQGKIEGETMKAIKETVNIWIQQATSEVSGEGGGGEGGAPVVGEGLAPVVGGGGIKEVEKGGWMSSLGVDLDWKSILLIGLLFLYLLLFIRFSMLAARVEELEARAALDSLASLAPSSPPPEVCSPSANCSEFIATPNDT